MITFTAESEMKKSKRNEQKMEHKTVSSAINDIFLAALLPSTSQIQ